MTGNLKDRPLMMLVLRVMRVMLWGCLASLLLVGGAIFYSVTSIQGRWFDTFTRSDTLTFTIIGVLAIISIGLLIGSNRLLKQNQ